LRCEPRATPTIVKLFFDCCVPNAISHATSRILLLFCRHKLGLRLTLERPEPCIARLTFDFRNAFINYIISLRIRFCVRGLSE
jgi:hypothetical protein